MTSDPVLATVPPTVLHVGCGVADPTRLPVEFFGATEWRELRLDIDPAVAPDIVSSITDMAAVESGSVQAVWSSHNLEHLYWHEVPVALREFRRVLAPGGFALITLPDLQQVAELIALDRLEEPAYLSPAGAITPLDILYGHCASIASGNGFMGHRTGFTARTLEAALIAAGFSGVRVLRDGAFGLWARAWVPATIVETPGDATREHGSLPQAA
ncbi:class I SAM-dependent methyltransferase [Roseicella aquatilis]|uniref:Methyltransferase domain-containing protein n=1 Tax=Roseicella aquatilis TaxID=2527868 RepID=A0A4R4D5J1_9PROT|nr:methyltransferase domain-containing protein [Roseicella aquatilis]TCZ52282.1 methyltransferase domain-containing protein [Roseicella aquatilis]